LHVIDDPRVGTELAGYRIESLLGVGGMSVVYLAEDQRLKRKVALKLLASSLAEDESFRERFLHESELAASIDHPNIVPIYEAGATEELLFIAMRYVEGRDLKELLQRGPLDPSDAIGLVAQVASALDAAHARDLVHRDVKPSNVLLDTGARPDGSDHVYLADFGITRRVSEEPRIGEDGNLMGTPDYIAPEQIAGEEVDGRADVYSLGCVLYECLVGNPPFRRDSELAVVFAHLEAEPPAPSDVRPQLPTVLDAVIARALAKEPEGRYPSCRELAGAALAVAVDEAGRRLLDVASRAAAGRSELGQVEAELAGKVIDLQLAREQAHALATPGTPTRLAAEGVCPFKGLASFEPVDADYFFGRERLVAELVARLVGAGFLGIVGPSGGGKSSVLRAGLLPALAGGVLPGSEGWRRVLLRPGERPMDELRRVLVSGAKDPLAEALETLPSGARLLLAVDQLEELFAACRSDAERAAFAGTLARAATDPDGRAVVVVALRADFYGRFAAYPELAELLGGNQVLVGPMQASELRRAVELPASRVGLRVEPELTDALVDDVEGEPGALPLLSTALLELWQKRADDALTLAAYHESGGVHGAVARLAENTYARIPDGQKPIVRALMLRLVGDDEADVPVRRRAPLAELDLERSEDAAAVLAMLADSRLVTIGEGSVEVAHEALLKEWPRLREWNEEDADGRRVRRHITQAATEWETAARDPGELYRGARLAAALDWSADHAFELNELEREFVTESRDLSERETRKTRRTNRRLRALLAGVGVLLAAAVAAGIFAGIQRGEARDAETAQLAQRLGAQALVEEDLDLALLLARQAVAIDESPQTRSYLFAALRRSPSAIAIMHGNGGPQRTLAISPDGRTLAAAGYGPGLVFYDARTYEQIGDPLPHLGAESLAYSPGGKTLAIGGDDGGNQYVRLVDAQTGKQLAEDAVAGVPGQLAFTRDGSRLVVLVEPGPSNGLGYADARITIRDASTLEQIGPTIRPKKFVGAYIGFQRAFPHFVLTADDRSLVTASNDGELAWWDLRTGRKTRTLPIERGLHPVALSPDGRTAVVGINRGIQYVELVSGTTRKATGGAPGSPYWVLFSPDGETVVSTNHDGTVTLWDAESTSPSKTLRGHWSAVQQPVFSPDGDTLYTASHDGTTIAWDLTAKRGLDRRFTFTDDGPIDSAGFDQKPGAISPDGRLVAVGLRGRGFAVWDAREVRPFGTPMDTGRVVVGLHFAPDGRTLAVATLPRREFGNIVLTIWDVRSRARLRRVPISGNYFAFSPDGSTLAALTERGLTVLDSSTSATLGEIQAPERWGLALSGDGKLIASARGWVGGADVWNVATRRLLASVDAEPATGGQFSPDFAVALSSDGNMLALAGWGAPRSMVRIVDVRTGELVGELDQGGVGAETLEFSSDGRVLAVGGLAENVASIWDVASGTQIGAKLTVGSRAIQMDLSSDGRHLLMTAANGEGAVWDIDPRSWAERACAIANRTLTREEWEKFLRSRPYEPACS
jgi:WD40 repeat protein/tRNA A-37 threonylcarbamoyl transferase component Bud32